MFKTIINTTALFFLFIPVVNAQIVVERILPEDGYLPGVQFQVKIHVSSLEEEKELVEIPPNGWTIGDMDYPGIVNDGAITWRLREGFFLDKTITYLVTPPRYWEGEGVFTGNLDGEEIGGMNTIVQGIPKPAGIFEHHADIGIVPSGDCTYDAQSGEYTIVGSAGIGGGQGHLVYSEVSCPFSLQATVSAENPSAEWGAILFILDSF